MKTYTLFSALALASAVAALPQQPPKPPSYAQPDGNDNTNVDSTGGGRKRPEPYTKQNQNGMPNFQGDPQMRQNEIDAVPGSRSSGSTSNRGPRPQSYGQNNNVNVDSNGRPIQPEDQQDEFSPEQNRRPQGSTNNYRPQSNNNRMRPGMTGEENMPEENQDENEFSPQQNSNRMRPGQNRGGMRPEDQQNEDQFSPEQTNRRPTPGQQNNNGMMPEDEENQDEDQPEDEENEDEEQPEDEEDQDQPEDEEGQDQREDEDQDQFSPSNRRPSQGQGRTRPGGIGAQQGNYPQNRPGSIGGIGPGGIGSPVGGNNFGPGSNPSQIGGQCVSQQEANQFVRRFIGILNRQGSDIGDAETTAEQIIAEDYIEISSSINTLEGQGDNGDTQSIAAESKQEWIDGMLAAPPFAGIQTLKVLVFCDQVVWYWNFASVGSGQFPVKGFNLFTLRRGGASGCLQGQGQFSAGGSGSGSIGGSMNGQFGGSSQLQGGANIQGQGSGNIQGSGSGQFGRPSGLPNPGPASRVPTGSTIQAVKLETEFDSLANALDTGFQCTDRDGNDIQTSGSQQGGPMGGMANFQNNRPQRPGQNNQDQFDQGDESDLQDFQPDSTQGGRPGRGNFQSLQGSQGGRGGGRTSLSTNQRQGTGNGRNFEAGSDADQFDQQFNEQNFDQPLDTAVNNQFDTAGRGQFGSRTGGRTGGRLNANLNANSLAGQANGGTINEDGNTDSTFDSSLLQNNQRQGGGRTREGAGPQGLAALQANEERVSREGGGGGGDGGGDNGGAR